MPVIASESPTEIDVTGAEVELKCVGKGDVRTSGNVRLIITSNGIADCADLLRSIYAVMTNSCTKEQWQEVNNWIGDWIDGESES